MSRFKSYKDPDEEPQRNTVGEEHHREDHRRQAAGHRHMATHATLDEKTRKDHMYAAKYHESISKSNTGFTHRGQQQCPGMRSG